MRRAAVWATTFVAVLGIGSAARAAGPATPDLNHLHVVDLGTLGGPTSVGLAVNDEGHVVGDSQVATGEAHAFLWRGGHMTDLGTLGGASSTAAAVNDHDWVVGWSLTATGVTHAFLWRNGHMTDLGSLPGAGISLATGVNDRGEIVGQLGSGPNGLPGGFVWRNGTMRRIGGSGIIQPTGVNAHGDICAYFQKAAGADTDAVLLANGHRIVVHRDAVANAVNDFGAVAGWFDNGHGPTAYLWHLTTRRFVPLGRFPVAPTGATQAFGVNNRRQVAGAADVPDPQAIEVLRAVLWTSDGRPHLLPGFPSGDNSAQANDVNNLGQLAGQATLLSGDQLTVHAVIWTS
jgi:probable HAF family extracellular repeat protein